MEQLVVPLVTFRGILHALGASPSAALWCPAGCQDSGGAINWLIRGTAPLADADAADEAFVVYATHSVPRDRQRLAATLPQSAVGAVLVGDGALRGRWWGLACAGATIAPLDGIALIGPGMHQLGGPSRWPEELMPDGPTRRAAAMLAVPTPPDRWSRTVGALGGPDVWRRLVGLRYAIVGVGRTGSLLAQALGGLGVGRLSLVDPDLLETHNLGEMVGVTAADVGRPKVRAVADDLRRARAGAPPLEVRAIPASITSAAARAACLDADVLCCSVDRDDARLAAAAYATLYHKVLIDVGTGIRFASADDTPMPRAMGADVRLLLPGDGCLWCRGSLADPLGAIEALAGGAARPAMATDWRRQRAGSLQMLNQLATGIAVQLLQDLVAERVQTSTWAQLSIDDAGRVAIAYPSPELARTVSCPLCARAGLGDAGLAWLPRSAMAQATGPVTPSGGAGDIQSSPRLRLLPGRESQ